MSKSVGTVLIDIKADTTKLVSGMERAEKTVKNKINSIKKTLLTMAAAYASFAGINAFKGMITGSIEAADNIGKLAQKLGMTSDELSKLKYAASYANVSIGQLNAGLSAMIRRSNNFIRTGSGAAAKAFKELGISVEFAKKHFTSTEKIFEIITARLAKMPDGYKKTAIAQDIFSKSASDVLRVASMGSKEIKRLSDEAVKMGVVVPQNMAKMAADYEDSINHISKRISGIKTVISYGLLEPMRAGAKAIDEWFSKAFGNATNASKSFAKTGAESFKSFIYGLGFIKDTVTGIKLVLLSVKTIFYGVATAMSMALEPIVVMLNEIIRLHNKIANTYIGKKLHFSTWDFSLQSSLPDNIQKTIELSKEVKNLSYHLHDGRDEADRFNNIFNKMLKNGSGGINSIKNDYKTVDSIIGTIENSNQNIIKNNQQILTQYQNYFTKIGDYADAWAIKEEQIRQANTKLSKEELSKLLSIEKKEYFDKIQKEQEDKVKKAEELRKKEIEEAKREYQKWLIAHGSMTQGMTDQWKRYVDSMPTEYEQGIEMMKTITQSLDDAWTKFFDRQSESFLDFGDLAKSVLNDIEKQMIKTQLVQPLTKATSGLIDAGVSAVTDALFDGWDNGGYTYRASNDKTPVGVVHANEYVIPAWMVRKHPSLVQGLEAERRGLRGFWDGGFGDDNDFGGGLDAALGDTFGGGFDSYGGFDGFSGGALGVGSAGSDISGDYGGGNDWGANTVQVTTVTTTKGRAPSTIAPADVTVVDYNKAVEDMFTEFDGYGKSKDSKSVSIDFSSAVGKLVGSLVGSVFGPLGSLLGGKIGGKIGEKADNGAKTTISLGAKNLEDYLSNNYGAASTTSSSSNANINNTLQALNELQNGDYFNNVNSTQTITEASKKANDLLVNAYKADVIDAEKDIWKGLIDYVPNLKDDAKADWATLFNNYIEQGNEALLETTLNGSIFDTPDFYSTWKEYADNLNESVSDALKDSFSSLSDFKFDYTSFLLKDSPVDLKKYEYDYYQNIAEQYASTMGVDYGVLNKDNFLEKMNDSLKQNLTPDNISNWEKLGKALMDAYNAEEKYRNALEDNVAIRHGDMLLPNVHDATKLDMSKLQVEINSNDEETKTLFYAILKELKLQTSLQQGLPA